MFVNTWQLAFLFIYFSNFKNGIALLIKQLFVMVHKIHIICHLQNQIRITFYVPQLRPKLAVEVKSKLIITKDKI